MPESLQQAIQIAVQQYSGGQLQQSEQICRQILQHHPDQPEANYLLGLISLDRGQIDSARQLLSRCVTLNPRFPQAWYKLGVALSRLNDQAGAITAFRQAIQLQPDFPEALTSLGQSLLRTKRFDEALTIFRTVAALHPHSFEAHNNLGIALAENGRLQEAAAAISTAIQYRSNSAEAHRHLGKVMALMERPQEAISSFKKAIELKPDGFLAQSDLGVALVAAGRVDEGIAAFQQAIHLKPDFASAHWHYALALLLKGDLAQGWPEYEWRWPAEGFTSPRRNFVQPQWDGANIERKTILLHAEQGFGDTIQFIRYAEQVAARGAKVLVESPAELIRLLSGVRGITAVISAGQSLPAFDVHCPLLSLPGIFKTNRQTIPASVPYLAPDAKLVSFWEQRLGDFGPGLRVGLAWSGRSSFVGDKTRSLQLSALAPLASVSGVTFFSLQKGPAAEQALNPPAGMKLLDLSADLRDFADTAAVISHMDLIISTDTSIPHLAGAMGKPVWLMLQFVPDWRWLLEGEDCPWYPTMRLFRQPNPGDWATVIHRVANALARTASEVRTRLRIAN